MHWHHVVGGCVKSELIQKPIKTSSLKTLKWQETSYSHGNSTGKVKKKKRISKNGEKKTRPGKRDNANITTDMMKRDAPERLPVDGEQESVILAEMRKLRQEHTEAVSDHNKALERLEFNMKELVERTASLEQRTVNVEGRLRETEDRAARLERSVAFLLHQEAKLAAKCDDLELRARRNNVRIHSIPEGSEKNDTIGFVMNFIRSSLQVPEDMDVCIERAHRSLVTKPKESTASHTQKADARLHPC